MNTFNPSCLIQQFDAAFEEAAEHGLLGSRTDWTGASRPTTYERELDRRAPSLPSEHLPQLLDALDGWAAHTRPVWDAIELIEALRAQHVFPMSLCRLAEHEWDSLVGGAADVAGRAPHSFDADQ